MTQLDDIRELMRDKTWRTLDNIAEATGIKQTSVSADLRHLRKAQYGSHTVNRMLDPATGIFMYQLVLNENRQSVPAAV